MKIKKFLRAGTILSARSRELLSTCSFDMEEGIHWRISGATLKKMAGLFTSEEYYMPSSYHRYLLIKVRNAPPLGYLLESTRLAGSTFSSPFAFAWMNRPSVS